MKTTKRSALLERLATEVAFVVGTTVWRKRSARMTLTAQLRRLPRRVGGPVGHRELDVIRARAEALLRDAGVPPWGDASDLHPAGVLILPSDLSRNPV